MDLLFKPMVLLKILRCVPFLSRNGVGLRLLLKTLVFGVTPLSRITPESKVLLEIGTGISIPFSLILIKLSVDFHTFPHNIEHLVPAQGKIGFQNEDKLKRAEFFIHKRAISVFVISAFDQKILLKAGVENIHIFTYFPTGENYSRLSKIRERRKSSPKKITIVLGSVLNGPTKIAFEDYLNVRIIGNRGPFYCIGHGMKRFRDKIIKAGGICLDGLTDLELDELLVESENVVVPATRTSGLITRVVDMNLAGIPVNIVGDYEQFKGHEQYGIYCNSIIGKRAMKTLKNPEKQALRELKRGVLIEPQ